MGWHSAPSPPSQPSKNHASMPPAQSKHHQTSEAKKEKLAKPIVASSSTSAPKRTAVGASRSTPTNQSVEAERQAALARKEMKKAKWRIVRKKVFWCAVRHTVAAVVLPGIGNGLLVGYDAVEAGAAIQDVNDLTNLQDLNDATGPASGSNQSGNSAC
ncbi:hypothetical protein ACJZ2D_001324 [Fusarium nematophilum]